MTRTTNAVAAHRKKKRLLKKAKGFWGDRKNHLGLTKEAVMRSMAFNYIHRKQKKRNFRRLWITRISAAAKICGISYSKFIHGLQLSKILINRKVLSEMAHSDMNAFRQIAEKAKVAIRQQ